jgi:hypothetical protein
MTIAGGHSDIRSGAKWIGDKGWVWVDRDRFEGSNPEWSDYKSLPDELAKIKLYKSTDHYKNFIECVKARKPTITPVETAHHSAIPGHLSLIAMLVKRKIKWDSKAEQIIGDSEAAALLTRKYREGYSMPS